MTAKQSILTHFPDLPPRLQEAARYLIDHPGEIVSLSMRGLAEKAGILPATLSRLAAQVGYAGWSELKAAFANDLGLIGKGYGERATSLASRGSDSTLMGELFDACHANLHATREHIESKLNASAQIMRAAATVHIVGFRASFAIAFSLFYGYRLFRDSVELIDGHCGGLEMQLRRIRPTDAVVIVSFAPYSKECLEVIEAARRIQAKVVTVTDSEASPLALKSDATLLFATESPSFFPSISAGIVTVEALLETLVAQSDQAAIEPIKQAEQHLVRSGAYI